MGEVTLEDVTKRYEDVTAVDNISLDIPDESSLSSSARQGAGRPRLFA